MTKATMMMAFLVMTTAWGCGDGSGRQDDGAERLEMDLVKMAPLMQAELDINGLPFRYVGFTTGEQIRLRFWAMTKEAHEKKHLVAARKIMSQACPRVEERDVVIEIVDQFSLVVWTNKDYLWDDSPWTDLHW